MLIREVQLVPSSAPNVFPFLKVIQHVPHMMHPHEIFFSLLPMFGMCNGMSSLWTMMFGLWKLRPATVFAFLRRMIRWGTIKQMKYASRQTFDFRFSVIFLNWRNLVIPGHFVRYAARDWFHACNISDQ